MNLAIYAPQALALANTGRGIKFDCQHAALGLATEAGELIDAYKREIVYGKPLDHINVIEETGDVLWYLNLLAETLGRPLHTLNEDVMGEREANASLLLSPPDALGAAIDLNVDCAMALASARDLFISERDTALAYSLTDTMTHHLIDAFASLLEFCDFLKFSIEEAADANAKKLNKRYPNGFNVHDAINRDTAAERVVLEGAAQASLPLVSTINVHEGFRAS